MDAGTMGFIADGEWLGTAFDGLNKIKSSDGSQLSIYPIVSCVWVKLLNSFLQDFV
jgi:hypothetical protein